MWLTTRAYPTDAELRIIAKPLGKSFTELKGTHEVHEHTTPKIYDGRGEPVPDNLSPLEIDVIRDMRVIDACALESIVAVIHNMADTARKKQKKAQGYA